MTDPIADYLTRIRNAQTAGHKIVSIPVIQKLGRISKPGLRKYAKADNIPRIINGLGICIVSTSKGLMTDKQARNENVGGELLCYVY